MNDLAVKAGRLEALAQGLEKKFPAVHVETEHHLHAGVYTRTVYIPKDCVIVGLTIRIPTQVIACGHFVLTDGGEAREFRGYHVFDGAAGRRAAVRAIENTALTMLFHTNAKTVEEAENEFTDEPERLLTRKEKKLCLE